jgi:hypothetical protein
MKKLSKIIAMILSVVMCVAMFSACGNKNESTYGPDDIAELLEKSNEAMGDVWSNLRIDMEFNADISMDMEMMGASLEMDMPMEMTAYMEVADKYAHGEMEMEMSMDMVAEYDGEKETQSEEMDESAEFYIVIGKDEVTSYTKNGDEDWVASKSESEFKISDLEKVLDKDLFSDATMSKEGDYYILSVKFADLLENADFEELFGMANIADLDDLGDFDIDTLADALEDVSLTYRFDSKYRLVEVSTGKIDIDLSKLMSEEDLEEAGLDGFNPDDIKISMEMSWKFSKFDEIAENDVKVPDDIKEETIGSDEYDEPVYGDRDIKDDESDGDLDQEHSALENDKGITEG